MKQRRVVVNDSMQKDYVYYITKPAGRGFDPEFLPELTPKQMLEMGVFGGKYMTDCRSEFPKAWFANAKLVTNVTTPAIITLESMLLCHYPYGGKSIGFIRKTPGDGFNGIAGTTWGEDARMTNDRLKDGKP